MNDDIGLLLDRVTPGLGGCWVFTGALSGGCYCRIAWHGRTQAVHRIAYELTYGPIPDGLVIDHVCHNRSGCTGGWCPHRRCVNPDHLEAVTPEVNVARSHLSSGSRQCCPHGHEYTSENTYMVKSKGKYERRCLTCNRANSLRGFNQRWAAMSDAEKDQFRARRRAQRRATRQRLRGR